METQALISFIQRIAKCGLFEELSEEQQEQNDAQYNWNVDATDAFEHFIQEARALTKDEPLVSPAKFVKLSTEDAILLGELCFNQIDEYRKLIQTKRLASTILASIEEEQKRLSVLAENLSR